MKKFIIINGKQVFVINKTNIQDAKHAAINLCDHSKEIIVREIEHITDFENTL